MSWRAAPCRDGACRPSVVVNARNRWLTLRDVHLMAAVVLLLAPSPASAADSLTLRLDGPYDARAAGYLVAADRGFFDAEDLSVTIEPALAGESPMQALATGRADLAITSLPDALLARQSGLPVVAAAQPFAGSALSLACLAESGVRNPATDLRGQIIGARGDSGRYALLAWLGSLGLGAADVTVMEQGRGNEALEQKRAACIEVDGEAQIAGLRSTGTAVIMFALQDQGMPIPDGGIYALQIGTSDPVDVDRVERFVRAAQKGWSYARAHPADAVQSLLRRDASLNADEQARRLAEVLALVAEGSWSLDVDRVGHTVRMMSAGPTPLLGPATTTHWNDVIAGAGKR